MIRLSLTIIFSICILNGCVKPVISYPYAENNTHIDSLFGMCIKDDYKWLELDNPANFKRTEWLAAQKKLTVDYFGVKSSMILNRIAELSEMSSYVPIEIQGHNVYYFKTNLYSNKTQLFAFDLRAKKDRFIADLGDNMRSFSELKASVSQDGKRLAVINSFSDTQNDLLIFDLEQSGQSPKVLSHVEYYKPLWYVDKVIYTKDGFAGNSYGNRVCFYDVSENKSTILYEDDINNIFDPIDLSLNVSKGILYVSSISNQNKYLTQSINLESSDFEVKKVFDFEVNHNYTYRAAGSDERHLFYIIYDNNFRVKVYTYNIETRRLHLVHSDPNRNFTYLNQVKDHLIVTHINMLNNKAILVNLNDSTKKEINIKSDGIVKFVNNKSGSDIIFMEESLIKSQVLMSSTTKNPSDVKLEAKSKYLPFDQNLFETKYVTIDKDTESPVNIIISYKKGLILNGKNPLLIYSYPNLSPREINNFFFSRILFMEQGVIFVQRSAQDHKRSYTLRANQEDLKKTIKYLIDNKYTSKDKLCLSGFKYGSTLIANLINENPDICKAALFTNGIFDMLNHNAKDKLRFNSQRFFAYDTKDQFCDVLSDSPYQAVKRGAKYPAMLVLNGENYEGVDPSHSYKYVAKLQMRTKGTYPILLFDQKKMNRDDSMLVYDYRERIYYTLSFVSEVLGFSLKSENFSYIKY